MTVFNTNDYAVGMAYIYIHNTTGSAGLASIDAQIASPAYHTHFCVGNTTAVEIVPDITYLDHYVSINGERRRDKTITTTSAISVNFTFDQVNATNVKRFLYGETQLASPTFIVNASPIKEVSAEVVFYTKTGKDFVYKIPRAALKADGGLSYETEDWMSANMMLDVLYDSSYTHNSVNAPYGYVNFAATSGYVD